MIVQLRRLIVYSTNSGLQEHLPGGQKHDHPEGPPAADCHAHCPRHTGAHSPVLPETRDCQRAWLVQRASHRDVTQRLAAALGEGLQGARHPPHPLYPGNLKGANAKYNTNHN